MIVQGKSFKKDLDINGHLGNIIRIGKKKNETKVNLFLVK